MAEISPSQFQGMYNKIEARSKYPQTSHSLRQQIKNEQFQIREQIIQKERRAVEALDQRLYSLKNNKWNVQVTRTKQVSGLCCSSCTSSSRASLCDEIVGMSTINVLKVEKLESHPKGFLAKIFSHICQAVSFKMFTFPYIYDSVLKDEKIENTIEKSSLEILESSNVDPSPSVFAAMVKKQRERAAKILTALRSTFSDLILRIASYTMTKVFGILFSSVIVNPTQINMLRRADSTKLPLIFLPLHRSHIDYIIITYVLCNNNIRSPLVAAGENLRIPVFGWLLRGLGAFFIKRRVNPKNGEDILYRAILQTYMVHCLCKGHNFEFFIEGGRTRSGKPCMPRNGLLSVIIDAYMDGTIDDALVVPVSINYERLVEGNFIREQMGEPKLAESFGSAISAIWKALISHYGNMRVDFNQPFSLREMVTKLQKKLPPSKKALHSVPSTTSLFGTNVNEYKDLVSTIARHVIFDCCSSTAMMSTNVVSFLLLNKFRNGVTLDELVLALDKLREEFSSTNKTVGFSGESIDVVNHAIEMLGTGLIKKEKRNDSTFIMPVTMLPNVIELCYYSNSVLPHFVLEAVVARSIQALLKENDNSVYYNELLEKCLTLCEILQFEFIFTKPCESLETELLDVIDKFVILEALKSQESNLTQDEQRTRRLAKHIDGFIDDDDDEYDDLIVDKGEQYLVNKANQHLCFYSVLLQPFVDLYTSCALNLERLVSRQVPEKDYIREIIDDVKSRLNNGQFKYNECLAVDSIRNSFKLLEKWNVLDCHIQDNIKLYYLAENFDDESSLVNIVSQIEQYQ